MQKHLQSISLPFSSFLIPPAPTEVQYYSTTVLRLAIKHVQVVCLLEHLAFTIRSSVDDLTTNLFVLLASKTIIALVVLEVRRVPL